MSLQNLGLGLFTTGISHVILHAWVRLQALSTQHVTPAHPMNVSPGHLSMYHAEYEQQLDKKEDREKVQSIHMLMQRDGCFCIL